MLNKSWGFIDFCLLIFLNEKVSQAPTSPKGLTELGEEGCDSNFDLSGYI